MLIGRLYLQFQVIKIWTTILCTNYIFLFLYYETAWARYFASMICCLSLKSSYTMRQWSLIWNWNNIMYDVIHNSVMTQLSCWKLPQSMNICSSYVNIRDKFDRNHELLLHYEARGFFPFFILLLLFEVHGKWVIVHETLVHFVHLISLQLKRNISLLFFSILY